MEGSESEAIFESFNLKPQLFINESLNIVDELVDGAFHHFHLEASKLLKTDGTDRSEDLQKGIDYIQNTIQASLDKRLVMWEQYCLRHCFTVPSGFSLPSGDEASGDDLMDQDDPNDEQVEAQLDNLRNKLAEAGKECSELKQELRELERKSTMSNQYISSVNEALQLYEKSSAHDMFQDLMNVASELRHKMEQLKSKEMKEIERSRKERANDANGDIPELRYSKGLSKLGLDDLQEFMTKMNSMT
ncbi:protein MIS12 homolog [Chenopodium quinoa]|uniref:protein MIS12 homolog n=1 Tax=Chenopodium quinoa TaxID=63459 RepID=UPI000B77E672|nr:protein MIS12 homolog [Chenopodium quinoa]